MFENITKGEYVIVGYAGEHDEGGASIKCGNIPICSTSYARKDRWDEYYDNAKFIAYCFNLQQKYDIGLFEELIKAVENISFTKKEYYGNSVAITEAELLLNKIINQNK